MIAANRIESNAQAYVLEKLVPGMPTVTGAIFATAAPFVIRAKMKQYLPVLTGTEIIDGENIDVDLLYRELKKNMQGKWPVTMAGFTFREMDLDELYQYMMR